MLSTARFDAGLASIEPVISAEDRALFVEPFGPFPTLITRSLNEDLAFPIFQAVNGVREHITAFSTPLNDVNMTSGLVTSRPKIARLEAAAYRSASRAYEYTLKDIATLEGNDHWSTVCAGPSNSWADCTLCNGADVVSPREDPGA